MLKIFVLYIVKTFLSVLKLFPLKKNRCFFESYNGSQFSCNPKALFEFFKIKNENFEYIWSLNSKSNVPSDVIVVKPKSLKYFYYLITSKFVFTNIELSSYIPKKRNALWFNTWHGGGAFKKVEHEEKSLYQRITKRIVSKNTNFYISSSEKFTQVMQNSTGIEIEKFLPIGMPRNDVFFDKDKIEKANKSVRNYFGLLVDDFVVLYAPTYRGNLNSDFDIRFDFKSFYDKAKTVSGKNVRILFRAHHAMLGKYNFDSNFILDATNYPDMQELLCVTDFLITDYSSTIWDYSLLKRPAALFVPDLEKYESNRGLYTSIETWPFPYFKTNQKLCEKLSLEPEIKKIESYLLALNSYEKGTACESVFKIIMEK